MCIDSCIQDQHIESTEPIDTETDQIPTLLFLRNVSNEIQYDSSIIDALLFRLLESFFVSTRNQQFRFFLGIDDGQLSAETAACTRYKHYAACLVVILVRQRNQSLIISHIYIFMEPTLKNIFKIGEMLIDPKQVFWKRQFTYACIPVVQLLPGRKSISEMQIFCWLPEES